MATRYLEDRLLDAKVEAEAGMSLRVALRTALGCNLMEYDAMTDGDLLARLADAICYEYFPRPQWKDGEPVHVYDRYMNNGELREVTGFFTRVKLDNDTIWNGEFFDRYTRIEPDTQERIDSDSEMWPYEYVSDVLGQSTTNMTEREMQSMMVCDLLRRQRELDGRGE